MIVKASVLVAALCAQIAAPQSPQPLPKFEDFPASEVFKGPPAIPILRTKLQRTYRTMIRDAAKDGPNFAGRYTIASAGCGSGCVVNALVDEKTGQVFDFPFDHLALAPVTQSADSAEPDLESYKLNSRLLIVRGCPQEKNCATYFYEWTGTQFKLLRKTALVSR